MKIINLKVMNGKNKWAEVSIILFSPIYLHTYVPLWYNGATFPLWYTGATLDLSVLQVPLSIC